MIPENVPAPKITDRLVYLDKDGRIVVCDAEFFRAWIAPHPREYKGVWEAAVIMRNPVQLIDFLFTLKNQHSVRRSEINWFWIANDLNHQFPSHMLERIKKGLGIDQIKVI